MIPIRRVAPVLVAAWLAAAAEGQEPKPLSESEWSQARAGLARWLWAPQTAREKERKLWEERGLLDRSMTKSQAAQLARLLKAGNPYLAARPRLPAALSVPSAAAGESSKVLLQMPPGWRPERGPVGLVVAVHGGPATDWGTAERTAAQELRYFSGPAGSAGCILAAPAIKTMNQDPAGARILFGLIEELAKSVNLDRDRIWLVGHSAGGVCSFMVGCPWADRFAGIGPFVCGIYHGERLANAANLPVYHVLGKRDNPFFLSTGRQNSQRLQQGGGPLLVVEKEGGHDVYTDECAKAIAWLAGRPRKFWAKIVRWTPDPARTQGGFYWVEADAGAAFQVAVKDGGKIEVTGASPTALLLSDALVDLDRPLEVVRDGQPAFQGKAARTLRVALEWVDRTGDGSAVPTARVALSK